MAGQQQLGPISDVNRIYVPTFLDFNNIYSYLFALNVSAFYLLQ